MDSESYLLSERKSMLVMLFLSTRIFPKFYEVRTLSAILNSSLISSAGMIDFSQIVRTYKQLRKARRQISGKITDYKGNDVEALQKKKIFDPCIIPGHIIQ